MRQPPCSGSGQIRSVSHDPEDWLIARGSASEPRSNQHDASAWSQGSCCSAQYRPGVTLQPPVVPPGSVAQARAAPGGDGEDHRSGFEAHRPRFALWRLQHPLGLSESSPQPLVGPPARSRPTTIIPAPSAGRTQCWHRQRCVDFVDLHPQCIRPCWFLGTFRTRGRGARPAARHNKWHRRANSVHTLARDLRARQPSLG